MIEAGIDGRFSFPLRPPGDPIDPFEKRAEIAKAESDGMRHNRREREGNRRQHGYTPPPSRERNQHFTQNQLPLEMRRQ
jgi:hypothetical protein